MDNMFHDNMTGFRKISIKTQGAQRLAMGQWYANNFFHSPEHQAVASWLVPTYLLFAYEFRLASRKSRGPHKAKK